MEILYNNHNFLKKSHKINSEAKWRREKCKGTWRKIMRLPDMNNRE